MRSWQTLLIGQSDPAACDVTADRLQFPPSQTEEQSLCSSLIFWVNNQFYQFECFRVFVLQKRFYQTLFTSTWLILGLRQLLLSLCLKQTVINFSVWIEKLCDNILQRDHRNVSAERVSTAKQKMMNNKKTHNTNIFLTSQMVCCHGDLSSVNTNNNSLNFMMSGLLQTRCLKRSGHLNNRKPSSRPAVYGRFTHEPIGPSGCQSTYDRPRFLWTDTWLRRLSACCWSDRSDSWESETSLRLVCLLVKCEDLLLIADVTLSSEKHIFTIFKTFYRWNDWSWK